MGTVSNGGTAASCAQVFGPYKRGDGYRCIVELDGRRHTLTNQTTEQRARRMADRFIDLMQAQAPVSIQDAMERYREYMLLNDRKPATVTTTQYRLRRFFGDTAQSVKTLTAGKCAAMYAALVKQQKADTHRNTLAEAKTFARWLVSEKILRENPIEGIKPTGRRSRGKEQLTRDEARRWLTVALEEAGKGCDAALVAAMTLLMGLRPGEVIVRTVRDVDSAGTRLRVRQAKTRAGDRDPKIPAVLQPLVAARCAGKQPADLLFPASRGRGEQKPHTVSWVRKKVTKLCQAAGVPEVCTYSMRGLHADLAIAESVSPDVVARGLGHESSRTTMAHYAKPGTLREVQADRAAQELGVATAPPHLRLVS